MVEMAIAAIMLPLAGLAVLIGFFMAFISKVIESLKALLATLTTLLVSVILAAIFIGIVAYIL